MKRIKAFLPAVLLVVVIVCALIMYKTFMAGVSAPGSGFQAAAQLLPSEQPESNRVSAAPSENASAVSPSSTSSSSIIISSSSVTGSSLAENASPVTSASTDDNSTPVAGSSSIEGLSPGGTGDQALSGSNASGQGDVAPSESDTGDTGDTGDAGDAGDAGDQASSGSGASGQGDQNAPESGASGQGEQAQPGSSEGSQESARIKAPDFTVLDANGNTVKLSDMVGKPVVLNFWASWCPPCRQEMPDFDKVYKELGDKIHFFMVDAVDGARETMEKGEAFIAESGFSFPVYYDVEREAVTQFGIRAYPTSFFIDKEGYAVVSAEGTIGEASLRLGIDMIMD